MCTYVHSTEPRIQEDREENVAYGYQIIAKERSRVKMYATGISYRGQVGNRRMEKGRGPDGLHRRLKCPSEFIFE